MCITTSTRLQLPPAVGARNCRTQEPLGSDSHSRESARQSMMWQPSVAEHSPPLLTESWWAEPAAAERERDRETETERQRDREREHHHHHQQQLHHQHHHHQQQQQHRAGGEIRLSPLRDHLSLSLSLLPPPRLPPSSPDAHTSGPEPLEAAGFRDASVSPPVLPEMRIRRRRAPGWRYIKTRYSPSRSHQKRKTTAAALRSNTPETQRQRERRSRGFGHTVCLLSTVADPPL